MFDRGVKWFSSLTRLGVGSGYEDDISRRIEFSNVVFICLPVVYFIFMVIDYDSYLFADKLSFDQFVVPIIIAICFFNLWLNLLGWTTVTRVVFIVLWPLLLHLIPIKLQQAPPDYFLAYPFGIVFHAMLIQLMFSHRKERKWFVFFMVLNLVALITAPAVLQYFDMNHDIPNAMVKYKYYLLDGILYWLLFNLVTFYILLILESYIKKVNNARMLIEEQKEELNAINQNLEGLVSQRTFELEKQNEKLRQHAYFNAHLLRGPFCRVQGLIQIQDTTKGEENLKDIKLKLIQSLEELDDRIREIQKLVETKEEDHGRLSDNSDQRFP